VRDRRWYRHRRFERNLKTFARREPYLVQRILGKKLAV
jgi:hypothetical protein